MLAIRSRTAAFVGAGALALGVPALAGAAVGVPGIGLNTGLGLNTAAAVGAPGIGLNTGIGVNVGAGVNAHPGYPGWGRGNGWNGNDPYGYDAYHGQHWSHGRR